MNPSSSDGAHGGCLCGDIRFTIKGSLAEVTICHCAMCRRASTSVGAYTACAAADITMTGKPRWYRSSPTARRGFCAKCGSTLFWERIGGPHLSVSLGGLDDPRGLQIGKHIFVDEDTTPTRMFAPIEPAEPSA